jgi:hypothetical protein
MSHESWGQCVKYQYDISSSLHNQMVLLPNDSQKMVGMAISVAISWLDLDKRKGLMSSLESRNDMVA